MPSGPRKRRAAKRKKEMEEQMKTPSPSDSPRDAGQSEDRVPHEGGEEADRQSPTISSEERFGSDAADSAAAESSKNPKGEDLVVEDERELVPAVKEVAFRPEDESAAKSNEIAESEKENSNPAEESTISVGNAIDLTERSQATEFAARVLEETSGDNTERADGVFNHDGDGHRVAGGDETSPATEVLEERNQVMEAVFRPEDESAAKSNEVAESEKENSKPAEESTISVDHAIDLTERSQATEFAARVFEATSGDNSERADGVFNHDGDAHRVPGGDETSPATEVLEERNQVMEAAAEVLDGEKESQLPDVDVAVKREGDDRQAAAGDEALPATELLHRSPLVDRRTNRWWNCCGLLDFVSNPDG